MKPDDIAKELTTLKKELVAVKTEYNKMRENNETMEKEMENLRDNCRKLESEVKEWRKGENGAGAQKTRVELDVGELIRALPEFSLDRREGAKAKEWTEAVDRLKSYYSVENEVLLAAIRAKWTGSAQQWLQFRNKSDMSWDSLKDDLINDFNVKKSKFQIMSAVGRTMRRKGQSLVNYFLEMTALAEDVMEEEDIVRTIMSNSRHPILGHGLEGDAWAREKVSKEELWRKVVCLDERERLEGEGKEKGREREVALVSCYNCGRGGHIARECHLPIDRGVVTCYRCQKKGHVRSQCTAKVEGVKVLDGGERQVPRGDRELNRGIKMDQRGEVVARMDGDSRIRALVDTGSAVSAIKNSKIINSKEIGKWAKKRKIRGINGAELKVLGQVEANLEIGKEAYKANLLVVPEETMVEDAILGRDFLRENGVGRVEWQEQGGEEFREICRIEWKDSKEELNLEVGDDKRTRVEKRRVEELFQKNYLEVDTREVVPVRHEVRIRLRENKIVCTKPRRMSVVEKEAVKEEIDRLMKEGIIRESDSEYASRVVLVKKKDGRFRMCIDYRRLNELVEKEHYPMPVIEDVIQKLQGKKYFTSLDLKNGFYHVDVAESSKRYTAFLTTQGQYEYNKLPFGFANAPSAFIRYMAKVLKKFSGCENIVYFMDDIVVATETVEEHLEVLGRLLSTLAENRVKLQMTKCHWLRTTIDFLGYKINERGITPSEHHVEAIKMYPRPIDVKGVQRFIGLVGYFRKFIRNFKDMVAPLLEVVKVNKFNWEKGQEEAFCGLRDKLLEGPVLKIFSHTAETELHTDASAGGFGAVLMQRNKEDEKLYPVFYYSKKTTEAERKLHSFELETLAVVYSLQRFRAYLFGKKFKLVTDCSAMQMTLAKRDVSPKIERWALWMNEFDFSIEHRKGERMKHADALSRINMLTLEELEEEEEDEEGEDEDGEEEDWKMKIVVAQLRDDKVNRLREQIVNGTKKGYEVRENIVYRKDGKRLQLVIPDRMIGGLIFQMHDGMGHMGEKKTVKNIRRNFFFANMGDLVKEHIGRCLLCLKFNNKSGRKEHKLHLYEREAVPLDTVHIDHIGPLQKTRKGHQYILVVVDAFTKYVRLYATRTTEAKEAVKAMKEYGRVYGYPRRIISDRGTAFTAEEFSDWGEKNGVKHVRTATACPRANGQVERFNRTLVPVLAKLTSKRKVEWNSLLAEAEFVMNNMTSSATGDTPARLLYGVDQRFGQKFEVEDWMDDINSEEISIVERREVAKGRIDVGQQYNKEYYDRKVRKEHRFREGDLVLLKGRKVVGKRSKLFGKFKGPYRVERVLGRDRYLVSDIERAQVGRLPYSGVVSTERMKLYEESKEEEVEENSENNYGQLQEEED